MFSNKNENEKPVGKTHSYYIEKKANAIIKTYEVPVLPKLCQIIHWCMIILTASMVLVDINAFIRYDANLGIFHLLKNVSITGFFNWALFSMLLIPLSYCSIWQTRKRFWKRANNVVKDGNGNEMESNRAQSERALKRLKRPYMRYIEICVVGIIFFGLFYVIANFAL